MVFHFFFQAEDGIRDWSVTGVQTCALPISFVVSRHYLVLLLDHCTPPFSSHHDLVFRPFEVRHCNFLSLTLAGPYGSLIDRSEERRVGKECRCRWWLCQYNRNRT